MKMSADISLALLYFYPARKDALGVFNFLLVVVDGFTTVLKVRMRYQSAFFRRSLSEAVKLRISRG